MVHKIVRESGHCTENGQLTDIIQEILHEADRNFCFVREIRKPRLVSAQVLKATQKNVKEQQVGHLGV